MNIVVVGGGRVGRFGNDFVRRAKSHGHTVKVISHRSSKDTDAVINFMNIKDAVTKLQSITAELEHIDILLYNSTYKGHPENRQLFTSCGTINEKLYLYGFYLHVIVPHALALEILKKMNALSKILFVTTDVIYNRERTENLDHLGYYGGKAYQHQLMLALAECNDKNAVVSSISPYFNYNDKEEYKRAFEQVYEHIFSKTENGKVFDCWNDYA